MNSTCSALATLVEVLGREIEIVEDLADYAREEQRALLFSDLQALGTCSARLLDAGRRIELIETERIAAVALLSPDATVDELLSVADHVGNSELRPTYEKLIEQLADYRMVRGRNAQLISMAIAIRADWVDFVAQPEVALKGA